MRSRFRVEHDALWLVLAQILSSLSNFGVSIAALVALDDAAAFGAFGAALLAYRLSNAIGRSLVIEPILTGPNAREESGALPVLALGWGLLVSLLLSGIALAIGGTVERSLLVLAAFGPLLLAEDAVRQALVAAERARSACIVEAIWVVLAASGLSGLLITDRFSAATALAAWAAAGSISAVVGILALRDGITRTAAQAGLRTVRATIGLLAVSTVAVRGATQGAVALAGFALGIEGFGRLRAAQTLAAPAMILLQGARISSFRSSVTADKQIARSRRIHRVAFVLAVAWTVALLIALLLTHRWIPDDRIARGAIVFEGATAALVILTASAEIRFRFEGRYRELMIRSLIWAPVPLIGVPLGAVLLGTTGASAGMTLSVLVLLVLLGREEHRWTAPDNRTTTK